MFVMDCGKIRAIADLLLQLRTDRRNFYFYEIARVGQPDDLKHRTGQ